MTQTSHQYYVYCYFRLDGRPCYVGKGHGRRWKEHTTKKTNRHLRALIDQALAQDRELPVVILREGLTDDEAQALEITFIAAIGREVDGGPLVNFTDGGEGTAGLSPSEETRKKIGDGRRGKPHTAETRARMSAARKGIPKSLETRAKMSVAKKGAMSEAHKEAIRTARKGNTLGSEVRAKISAAMSGKKRGPRSEETKAKIAAAQRGRPRAKHTEESRAKIAASLMGGRRSEETKARMRAAWEVRRARQQ
jgi:hypothetical protein